MYLSCFHLTVGDGSNDFPFIISISSKAMLSVLLHVNESLIPVVKRANSPFQLIIMEWMDANGMLGVENGGVLHLIP